MPILLKYNFKKTVNPVFFCIIERAARAGIFYRNPFEYGYFGYLDVAGQVNVHTGPVNVVRMRHILEGRVSLVKSARILFKMERAQYLQAAIGQPGWTDDLNPTDDPSQIIKTGPAGGNAIDILCRYPEKNIWYQELDQACKYLSGANPPSDLVKIALTRGGNNCMKYGEGAITKGSNGKITNPADINKMFLFTLTITNLSTDFEVTEFNFLNSHDIVDNFGFGLSNNAPIVGTDKVGNPVNYFEIFQAGVTLISPTGARTVIFVNQPAFDGAPGGFDFGFKSDNGTIPVGGSAEIQFFAGIGPRPNIFTDDAQLPHKTTVTPVVGLNFKGDYIAQAVLNPPLSPIGLHDSSTIYVTCGAATAQPIDIVTDYGFCTLGPGGGPPPPPPVTTPPRKNGGLVTILVKVVDKTGNEVDLADFNQGDTAEFRVYLSNSGVSIVNGTYAFSIAPVVGLNGTFTDSRPEVASPGNLHRIDTQNYIIDTAYPVGTSSTFLGSFTYIDGSDPTTIQGHAALTVVGKVTDPDINTGQLILPVSIPSVPIVSKPTPPSTPEIAAWLAAANAALAAATTSATATSAAQGASQQAKAASDAAKNAIQVWSSHPQDVGLLNAAAAAAVSAYSLVSTAAAKVSATVATCSEVINAANDAVNAAIAAMASMSDRAEAQAVLDSARSALAAANTAKEFADAALAAQAKIPRSAAGLSAMGPTQAGALAGAAFSAVTDMTTKAVSTNSLASGLVLLAQAADDAAFMAAHNNESAELAQYPHTLNLTYTAQNTDPTIKIHVNSIIVNLLSSFASALNGMFKIVAISSLSFDLAPNESHDVVFSAAVLETATYTGTVTMQGSATGTGSDGSAKSAALVINPGHFQLISAAALFSDTIDFIFNFAQKVEDNNTSIFTRSQHPDESSGAFNKQWSLLFDIKVKNNSEATGCIIRTVTCQRINSDNTIDSIDVYALRQPTALDHIVSPEAFIASNKMQMQWDSINYRQLVSDTDYLDWFFPAPADPSIKGNVKEGVLVTASSSTEVVYEYRVLDTPEVPAQNKIKTLVVTVEALFANGTTSQSTNTIDVTSVQTPKIYEPILQGKTARIKMLDGQYKVTISGGMFLFLNDTRSGAGFGRTAHWAAEVRIQDPVTQLNNAPASMSSMPIVGGYAGGNVAIDTEEVAISNYGGDVGALMFNITSAMLTSPTTPREIAFSVSDRLSSIGTPLRPTAITIERLGSAASGTAAKLIFAQPAIFRHFLFTRADGITPLPNLPETINCEVSFTITNTGTNAAILQAITQTGMSNTGAVIRPNGFSDTMRAQYRDGVGPNCININQGNAPETFVNGGASITPVFVFPFGVSGTVTFNMQWMDVITGQTFTTPANSPSDVVVVPSTGAKSKTSPETDFSKFKYRFANFSTAFYPGKLKAHFLNTFISKHNAASPPRAAWGASTHYSVTSFGASAPIPSFNYQMHVGAQNSANSVANSDGEAFTAIQQLGDQALIGYPPNINTSLQMFDGNINESSLFGSGTYNALGDFYSAPGVVLADGRYAGTHVVSQDTDLPLWCSVANLVTGITNAGSVYTINVDYYIGPATYNKAFGLPIAPILATPTAKGGLKYLRATGGTISAASITIPVNKTADLLSGGAAYWGDNSASTNLCSLANLGTTKLSVTTTTNSATPPAFLAYTYIEGGTSSTPFNMTAQQLSGGTASSLKLNRWLSLGGPSAIQILPAFNLSVMTTISCTISYITTGSTQMNNSAVIVQKGNNTLLPAGNGCSGGGNAHVNMGGFCFDSTGGFYGPSGPSTNNVGVVFPPSPNSVSTATFSVTAKQFGGLTLIVNDLSVFKTL